MNFNVGADESTHPIISDYDWRENFKLAKSL